MIGIDKFLEDGIFFLVDDLLFSKPIMVAIISLSVIEMLFSPLGDRFIVLDVLVLLDFRFVILDSVFGILFGKFAFVVDRFLVLSTLSIILSNKLLSNNKVLSISFLGWTGFIDLLISSDEIKSFKIESILSISI